MCVTCSSAAPSPIMPPSPPTKWRSSDWLHSAPYGPPVPSIPYSARGRGIPGFTYRTLDVVPRALRDVRIAATGTRPVADCHEPDVIPLSLDIYVCHLSKTG